jgi:SAM-dependent methyltransferase
VDIQLGFGAQQITRNGFHPIELFRKIGRWYLSHDSQLAYHISKDPGSWECMEVIYENKPRPFNRWFPGIADRLFLGSKACKATRNRKNIAATTLMELVKQYAIPGDEFSVVSLGSGPAHDVITVLCNIDPRLLVFATCIDIDESALEHGRNLATNARLTNLEFVKKDVRRVDNTRKYDVASIIGLMEYLSYDNSVMFLSWVRSLLKPDGRIFISNMREHVLTRIMDFFGRWVLDYKLLEELKEIAEVAGFEVEKSFYEEQGLHSFVIGKKRCPSQEVAP